MFLPIKVENQHHESMRVWRYLILVALSEVSKISWPPKAKNCPLLQLKSKTRQPPFLRSKT